MKKYERVDKIVQSAKTFEWGYKRLNYNCENRNCRCNCSTCPIMDGKKRLCAKFDTPLPESDKYMIAPTSTPKVNITVNGNITVNVYGKASIRWMDK